MKKSSTTLVYLVNSLSKEELTYIKRTAIHYSKGGKNKLALLLKLLEKTSVETYDEKRLAKKIPNLSVRKRELFEAIVTSLANREKKNEVVVMLGKLRWAAMLHYRNLFSEAISLLKEVETWASDQNQLYILGVILQYKSFFANSGLYKKYQIDFSDMGMKMVKNAQIILDVTQINNTYLAIAAITRKTYLLRSENERQLLKKLLLPPLTKQQLLDYPESTRAFHFLSRHYVYRLEADYEKSYEEAKKCWKLMTEGPLNFYVRRPQEYLIAFVAYLEACIDAKRIEECKQWIKTFRKLWLEKYAGNPLVAGKYYCLCLAIHILDAGSKIKSGITDEAAAFHLGNSKILLEGGESRTLNFLLLKIYFLQKDFNKAWDTSLQILNSSANSPRKELFETTRLLFLLTIYETGKFTELKSQCQQLNGFIKKKKESDYELEKIIVTNFLKLSQPGLTKKNRLAYLEKLRTDLIKLSKTNNLCARQQIHYFDFPAWVDEKIEALS